MASDKEYLTFILEQVRERGTVTARAMMGEFILYYRGKIVGGIFDDRLLVKPVPAARRILPDAPEEIPYPNGKPMLLVEEAEQPGFLDELFAAMFDELPFPTPKKSKKPPISSKKDANG